MTVVKHMLLVVGFPSYKMLEIKASQGDNRNAKKTTLKVSLKDFNIQSESWEQTA